MKTFGRLAISALACLVATSAPADQRHVAASGSWRAVISTDAGERTCFLIASPVSRMPEGLQRDPGHLFVTLLDRRKGTQISSQLGYPLADVDHAVTIDGRAFASMSRDDTIWLKSAADESAVLAAMRAGRTLEVSVRSRRGNPTVDTYGLDGFSTTLAELQKRCGS